LEKIRASENEVRWQHEEDVDDCSNCKQTFTVTRRKVCLLLLTLLTFFLSCFLFPDFCVFTFVNSVQYLRCYHYSAAEQVFDSILSISIPLWPLPQYSHRLLTGYVAFVLLLLVCVLSLATQCIVISPVCVCVFAMGVWHVFVCGWVCYHDNSKLHTSILTKLRL